MCLLERWSQILLHELLLRCLRFPNLDDNELVARLACDVMDQGRRPVASTGRRIDIENAGYLLDTSSGPEEYRNSRTRMSGMVVLPFTRFVGRRTTIKPSSDRSAVAALLMWASRTTCRNRILRVRLIVDRGRRRCARRGAHESHRTRSGTRCRFARALPDPLDIDCHG